MLMDGINSGDRIVIVVILWLEDRDNRMAIVVIMMIG